ncbi:hypothetical protein [Moritella sp. F3]|uniref:hypothetical protein n=1 Tax=Moritella sp. F3 TaxID=2718882 RepID=UPI0018E19974|nr:hypothetical protein [Moritella sp. F3]GIC77660.1 hypothetical protein FMO001_23870 [Moritella sp. F1]GIC82073.1 hypothetical protein FMO003_23540 [Moritella sp. F3]
MTITQLLEKYSMSDVLKWLDDNKDNIALVPEHELEELVELRDHWEGKATELAGDVAKMLNVEIGEHSSGNCPVQNAIEAVYAKTSSEENAENDTDNTAKPIVVDGAKLMTGIMIFVFAMVLIYN